MDSRKDKDINLYKKALLSIQNHSQENSKKALKAKGSIKEFMGIINQCLECPHKKKKGLCKDCPLYYLDDHD